LTAARPVGLAAWQWLEIAAGQPRVVAATQEAFVPQMLNMELPAVAGVSFSKGCYPGQEIVARTQYLGKVKRRTFRARLASAVAPAPMSMPRRPATSIAVRSSAWPPPRSAASNAWSACRAARSKPARCILARSTAATGNPDPALRPVLTPAMCLILVAWRVHPDYPLVVAANRDEFFARPTAPAAFWQDAPQVLAGRDLDAGGTWMGSHPRRTLRGPDQFSRSGADAQAAPSRGALVADFLTGDETPQAYLERTADYGRRCNGYNLLVGDGETLWWASNMGGERAPWSPGCTACRTTCSIRPGRKSALARRRWPGARRCLPDDQALFALLRDDGVHPDDAPAADRRAARMGTPVVLGLRQVARLWHAQFDRVLPGPRGLDRASFDEQTWLPGAQRGERLRYGFRSSLASPCAPWSGAESRLP
jgi:folate-binding protein YgfZ